VETLLNDRVIGVSLDQLRGTHRTVGIAGGLRKVEAIRGALLGRWINVLITDDRVAEGLLAAQGSATTAASQARLRATR
jgi:DNA-binding transcriptional regulator LsrR (DeoR family)